MNCPICSSDDFLVVDTATTAGQVRRRRKCSHCGHRETTFELPDRRVQELERLERLVRELGKAVESGVG